MKNIFPISNSDCILNDTVFFHGSDSIDSLNINSKQLRGKDWNWLNTDITYTFNNLGYRCDFDFDDNFDFTNYIVVLGCSHILGTGSLSNTTIPSLLSVLADSKVINMGVAGASNEVIYQNLIWLLSRKHRPKNIVVCWTSLYRHLMYDKKMQPIHITVHNIHSRNDLKRFILKNYAVDYIERESFAKFEMVSCMQDMGVYAFNFFNADDYNLAKIDKKIKNTLFEKYSLGAQILFDFNAGKRAAANDVNSGTKSLAEYLNKYHARDIIGKAHIENIFHIMSHNGPLANRNIARFIQSQIGT